MNDMQQQPAPAKGGSKLIWVILGCFGCAGVAALLFFGVLGAGIFGIVKAAEPYKVDARQFLSQAGSGDVDGAYGHFSEPLKQKISKADLKAMVEANPDLFQVTDSTFNNVSFVNSVCKISGTVTGKSGKTHHALFRYVTENNAHKMVEFSLRDTPHGEGD